MHFSFSRLSHSPIASRAAVLLVALALSSLASCGRKHDTTAGGESGSGEFSDSALPVDLEKTKALLKANPDLVFNKDEKGVTPLHYAADKGYKEVAELLLASKAEVNAKDNKGLTPLHYAAFNGYKRVVELLLANNAEVNAQANDAMTPLHLAAFNDHKLVAELLLANKAEVNAKGSEGATPLHLVADRGYSTVAELLLANNADVNVKSDKGLTRMALRQRVHFCDICCGVAFPSSGDAGDLTSGKA
jgi:ankyrin repeat protein